MKQKFCCVIFCGNQEYETLSSQYPPTNKRIYKILELDDFELSNVDFKEEEAFDPELGRGHNEKLYLIWNEKPLLVRRVIQENPFGSTHFVWCDIGSFRQNGKMFPQFPNRNCITDGKVTFTQMQPFSESDKQNLFPMDERFKNQVRLMGGIFGGQAEPLLRFASIHQNIFQEAKQSFVFCGKDQDMYCWEVLRNPDLFQLIPPLQTGYDPWFSLHIQWNSC